MGIPERATWGAVLGWLAMGGIAAAAAQLCLRALRGPTPLPATSAAVLCALSLFLVPLFPTSHALDIGALFAERFLFAPSLGFVLVVAVAGRALLTRALPERSALAAGVALTALLTVAGGVRSQARALEWRDAVQLWRAAGTHLVDKRIHTNLSAAYIARGKLDLALTQIDVALTLEPGYRPALGNRGVILLQLGQLGAAREAFESLVLSDPNDVRAWFNLGHIALAAGDPELAVKHLERALTVQPDFPAAREALNQARRAADAPAQQSR